VVDQELPENGCPTPRKHRFATMEAALKEVEYAGFALNKQLYPYDTCQCGWIHLSSKKDRTPKGVARTLEQLVNLDEEEFAKLVRDEVRGKIHAHEAKLLRSSDLLIRWAGALKIFQIDINAQLAVKSGQRDPDTIEWRGRLGAVQLRLSERRQEARLLCAKRYGRRLPEQAVAVESDLSQDHQPELRRVAGERAIDRLIQGHRKEFTQYLVEEFEAVGAEIPARILRYAAEHGVAVSSGVGDSGDVHQSETRDHGRSDEDQQD
jgi:hypothetical protein